MASIARTAWNKTGGVAVSWAVDTTRKIIRGITNFILGFGIMGAIWYFDPVFLVDILDANIALIKALASAGDSVINTGFQAISLLGYTGDMSTNLAARGESAVRVLSGEKMMIGLEISLGVTLWRATFGKIWSHSKVTFLLIMAPIAVLIYAWYTNDLSVPNLAS